jgi:uncharacterized phage protein (TIGR01671 family)
MGLCLRWKRGSILSSNPDAQREGIVAPLSVSKLPVGGERMIAKYRGKRIDNNEWVYGVPVYVENKCWIVIPNKFKWIGEGSIIDTISIIKIQVDPARVGQYGEEKDTLEKEIYEGDLIDVECDYCDAGHHIYEVKRDGCTLTIDACGESEYDYSVLSWALEDKRNSGNKYLVIGNIHDNPELVKP